MADTLESEISTVLLELLKKSGAPLKPSEIAQQLQEAGHTNVDSKVVNYLLYGPLKGLVKQDRTYRWVSIDNKDRILAVTVDGEKLPSNSPAKFRRFIDYYKECVLEDEPPSASYPLFRINKDFICPSWHKEWNSSGHAKISLPPSKERNDFAVQLKTHGNRGALFYAYPVYIKTVLSQQTGQRNTVAIPIFLQAIDFKIQADGRLELEITPEWPRVNGAFLSGMFNSAEARNQFIEELGILDADGPPPDEGLADIVRRMATLDLPCELAEALDPVSLPESPPFSSINVNGIYNRAIIVIGEKSQYTVGLDRELDLLKSAKPEDLSKSALRLFFEDVPPPIKVESNQSTKPIYEVVPLNEEQRAAVCSAMTEPITVVTGPPGTGKSQIVTTILANAYLSGQRVLFTSRNHKAVDVVQERLNSLCGYPLAIRAGAKSKDRDLRSELIQFLTQMLSLTASQEDYEAEKEAKQAYERLFDQRNKLWGEMEKTRNARNQLDQQDQIVEASKSRIDNATWLKLEATQIRPNIEGPTSAVILLDYHLNTALGFWGNIRRWFRRNDDFASIKNALTEIIAARDVFGEPPDIDVAKAALADWDKYAKAGVEYIQAIKNICAFRHASDLLNAAMKIECIAEELAEVGNSLPEWGARLIAARGKLLPDRMKKESYRQAFGQYRAILMQLASNAVAGKQYADIMKEMEKLFVKISKVLPVWCVTNLSARGSLPFEVALFDVVVIDESSQCDIASALPLIFRAKRAVIIGDPQQLSHISTLEPHREQQLQAKYGITKASDMPFTYSNNSLFDLAATCAGETSIISLREHFRSHADIIGFSNKYWYGNTLRVCTDYRRLKGYDRKNKSILWTNVSGDNFTPRGGSTLNNAEAKAVCEAIKDLLINKDFPGTVGVVTPFRPQANRLRDIIRDSGIPLSTIDRAQLIIDTAHGFQGDERDIIFFSPCVSPNMSEGSKRFLARTGNLFNVAITRARTLLHVIGNQSACAGCGIPFIESFTAHVESLNKHFNEPTHFKCDSNDPRIGFWERPFFAALVKAGFSPIPQYPVNQYRLDMAIILGNIHLDIEIDGELYHKEMDGSRCKADVIRDIHLAALGWKIKRFWVYRIRDDMDDCVRDIIAALQAVPQNAVK